MPKDSAKTVLNKMRVYFRENWGVPSVIGFMLLLLIAAASMSISLNLLTNEVAISGYYALVVGVVLQLVCFLKYGERSSYKD